MEEDYQKMKGKGLISLVKTNPNEADPERITFAMSVAKFDLLGGRVADEVRPLKLRELKAEIARMENLLGNLNALLGDCQKIG